MITATRWSAADPFVVIDPEARPHLRERSAPRAPSAGANRLIEPEATTAEPHWAWLHMPPGATLLAGAGLLFALAAAAQTELRQVRHRSREEQVAAAHHGHKRHPLPRRGVAERSPWSSGDSADQLAR